LTKTLLSAETAQYRIGKSGLVLMKRKALALTLIMALLFSAIAGLLLVDSANANIVPLTYLPEITIDSFGRVTPETDLIKRTGFTYTLMGNVDGYVISILDSDIVFDGAGYTINASGGDNPGIRLIDVTGVTVKNVEVIGRYTSIYLYYSSNCLLTDIKTNYRMYLTDGSNYNTITNSTIKRLSIGLGNSNNNLFIKNDVQDLWVSGSNNRFYLNNFFLTDTSGILDDNFWDNGSVGNYWSSYLVKYPNASEIGNTGIGDTAYVIEREKHLSLGDPNATNIDNYPLMYPRGAPEVALLGMQNATYSGDCFLNFTVSKSTVWIGYSLDGHGNVTVSGNVTLSGLSSGLHNITVYAEDAFGNEGASETITFDIDVPFPITLVLASIVTVVIISIGLLVYFKKRKH
jgi:hypothetical protein